MSSRRLLSLALILTVLCLSACLIPFGHGSFAATHGPAAKFEAWRSLFLLLFLMSTAIVVAAACDLTRSDGFGVFVSLRSVAQIAPEYLSDSSPLRC